MSNSPNIFEKFEKIAQAFLDVLSEAQSQGHLQEERAPLIPPPSLPGLPPEDLSTWAEASGVSFRLPQEFIRAEATHDLGVGVRFEENPSIDYGKWMELVPSFVLCPSDVAGLQASLRYLKEKRLPFKVRAAGHSSGGQVLIDGGVVLDIGGLNQILEVDSSGDWIRVEAGVWWIDVNRHLHDLGLDARPPVLTDNWSTSVAGTLSVGGFGESSHLYGLQANHVAAMSVVTLDGELHRVFPGDPLFDFTLAGRGQLGVIADVTLKLCHSAWKLGARMGRWGSLGDFVADMESFIEREDFEFIRARVAWNPKGTVKGVVGSYLKGEETLDLEAYEGLKALHFTSPETISAFEIGTSEEIEATRWRNPWLCLEVLLPLPQGLKLWPIFQRKICEAGLNRGTPDGSSVMVLRNKDPESIPLAPLPKSPTSLLFAIRCEVTHDQVPQGLAALQFLRELTLRAGGKVYLMSIEAPPGDEFLRWQFGEETLERWTQLKRLHDPDDLLNPGMLPAS